MKATHKELLFFYKNNGFEIYLMKPIILFKNMLYWTSCENNPWHFLPLAKHTTSGLAAKGEYNENN